MNGYRSIWRYMLKPAMWLVLGLLTAIASQSLYIYLSGNRNNLSAFGSSFTSDLIWERLWANPTYPLGVVPGILIVSAPVMAILIHALVDICLRGIPSVSWAWRACWLCCSQADLW